MADVLEKSSLLDAVPPLGEPHSSHPPQLPHQQLQQEAAAANAAPPQQQQQQQQAPPPSHQQPQQQQQQKPATARANQDQKEGDNDSGVDESTQEKDRNGPISPSSPVKTPTSTSSKPDKSGTSRPPSTTPSNKSAPKSRSASKNRLLLKTPEPEPAKKVPMNKVQVGHAPSPNLKAVRSKIGSLDNATYKPGGGHVKIESKKIDIKAAPRIEAKNDKYMPKGGEKKIVTTKLQWNAKSKIGSLENAAHKPGGGDKKIETLKMDFKDKAKPKVGSTANVKHQPGGGDIKIQTQKLEIKAQSKVGSLDNVKHKPGGGEKKIFDDKDYLKNVEHSVALTTPPTQYWKAPRIQRATTLTSSMSLPAECLVLSVSMPSLNSEPKRPKSAGPKKKPGQAVHSKPFRLY
ncbi:microtubule-associated protein tau isoform X9 [Drosophila takahashii]|uniref:microtubule-associated protein tau isoform X9 n=1 Tax=Drosophila takahashii TaxID=29030 RepID=UPI001CF844FD|nr:microtubule-associated protein tau isoform X1 [Drosophila takahashii]